ncbi:MAG: hypothetical protein C0609_02420 [Deltaproteobacteria bacterium]|nr:MAG: hypothetical protein C0609_02420 [Deltaproteobacteria bacterium]
MIRINLLPVRAARRKENLRKHTLFVIAYLVCVMALIASVHLSLQAASRNAKTRIAGLEKQIAEVDKKIKDVQDYKKMFADLVEKIEIISSLEAKQKGPARLLYNFARLVPEKIWIESMVFEGNKLKLKGLAFDNRTLALFMSGLEASESFEKVRLEVSEKVERSEVVMKSFRLETNVVNPNPPKADQGNGKAG